MWNKVYELNSKTKIIHNKNDSIVMNTLRGQWFKYPKKLINLVIKEMEKEKKIQDIVDSIENDLERKYIYNLLITMKKLNMIVEREHTKKDNKLTKVTLCLTNRCNLKCIHCSQEAGTRISNEEMSFNQVCNIIDILENLSVKTIVLTGGEIFVRDDIYDILQYLHKKFSGKVSIMTNGTLINNKDTVKIIKKTCTQVDISLDGHNKESVKKIRGEGVYDKVLYGIKLLKEEKVEKITLSTVEAKGIDVSAFYDLCNKLEVKPIVRKLDPLGRAIENFDKLDIEKKYMNDETQNELDEIRRNINAKSFCTAGEDKIYISENGDVYPCPILKSEEYKIGNILSSAFMDYFNEKSKEILSKLALCIVDEVDECSQCDYRYFCTGGCPSADQRLFGKEIYRKQHCTFNKRLYEKVIWK